MRRLMAVVAVVFGLVASPAVASGTETGDADRPEMPEVADYADCEAYLEAYVEWLVEETAVRPDSIRHRAMLTAALEACTAHFGEGPTVEDPTEDDPDGFAYDDDYEHVSDYITHVCNGDPQEPDLCRGQSGTADSEEYCWTSTVTYAGLWEPNPDPDDPDELVWVEGPFEVEVTYCNVHQDNLEDDRPYWDDYHGPAYYGP